MVSEKPSALSLQICSEAHSARSGDHLFQGSIMRTGNVPGGAADGEVLKYGPVDRDLPVSLKFFNDEFHPPMEHAQHLDCIHG